MTDNEPNADRAAEGMRNLAAAAGRAAKVIHDVAETTGVMRDAIESGCADAQIWQIPDDPLGEWLGTVPNNPWVIIRPNGEELAEAFAAAPQSPYNWWYYPGDRVTIRLDDHSGIRFAAMLLGLPENLIRRPRMKYRAARRHAGYTRTGNRRPNTWRP